METFGIPGVSAIDILGAIFWGTIILTMIAIVFQKNGGKK